MVARPAGAITGRNGLIDKYFYFAMSLIFAAIVGSGFSRTVDQNLFHASIPRPMVLWFHGAAFSSWIVFYILQSTLVRVHKVSWHRLLGWFGAALAACMVVLGLITAIVMGRFDIVQMHGPAMDLTAFLSVPFYDMIAFASTVGLAIYWRKKPELHRRLLLIATCGLTDAALARWAYIFDYNLFFPLVDALILLGVGRDLVVNGRVHKVYLYALPLLIVGQIISNYMWRAQPAWWLSIGHSILGV
jgi:hypothetical protein